MNIIPIIERADLHGKRKLEYNSATRTLASAARWFTTLTGLEPGNVYELTEPVKMGSLQGPPITTWFFEWSMKQE